MTVYVRFNIDKLIICFLFANHQILAKLISKFRGEGVGMVSGLLKRTVGSENKEIFSTLWKPLVERTDLYRKRMSGMATNLVKDKIANENLK